MVVTLLGGLLLAGPLLACRQQLPRVVAGSVFEATFVATESPNVTPERRAAIGEILDSIDGSMTVERVQGDSIFGTFSVDFLQLGLGVGRASPGPQRFAGSTRRDSITLHLVPDATDAGLFMRGVLIGSFATGAWHVQQGRGAGTFRLRVMTS